MRQTMIGLLAVPLVMVFGLILFAGIALADEQIVGDDFARLRVIEPEDLDNLRGREGDQRTTLMNLQDLEATAYSNLINANSVTSGAVTIQEHALDNFHGVGLFNFVTGNNNAVDAAIGITFNLQ